MAKEINLFMQDIETVDVDAIDVEIDELIDQTADKPLKKSYAQSFLPDMIPSENSEKENQETQEKQDKQHYFRQKTKIKKVIEALLFSTNEPLTFTKIREITDTIYELKPRVLRDIIDELQNDFISLQMVYRLEEIAEGFLLRTSEEFSPYLNLLYRNKRIEKLSQAAAEVLAIIAYRQPITRPQIDSIRGVDSSGVIQALLERQLVEPLGKLEAPGRPMLFGITKDFLKHFGLKDLGELPKIDAKHAPQAF